MSRSLSVLVLEDSEVDCELIVRKLNKDGNYRTDHARVQSLAGLQAALDRQDWDIILSDHSMPQFTALNALQELQQRKLDIPVIILSGTIEASEAVAAMKAGAADFIMKDDMTRLLPAIARELREAESRREGRLSEAKLAEKTAEMLREQEKFRQITQALEEFVWLTNHDLTEVIYVSPAYEKIWGRTCESLYESPDDWTQAVPQAERGAVVKDVQTVLAEGGETEFRILRTDGTERWVRVAGFPIKDASGKVSRVAGITSDITREKQLQAQFLQAQRLDAVGRLAGSIAHDFNNILTAIGGYSHLILSSLPADDKRREDVEEVIKAAERAGGLTRQLLAFSRRQTLEPRVLEVNGLIANLERMLRRIIGVNVVLETVLSPEAGRIRADPGQIEQAVMNLVINAKDAMPDGGKVALETAQAELREAHAPMALPLPPGRYVSISVSDAGTGMDADTQSRLFEPFFTTKAPGKGTGLGLATVYGVVKQSGGGIAVHSEPGRGTTFKIYLPRVDAPVQPAAAAPAVVRRLSGSETVLLVEDDAPVRVFVARTLRENGYNVLAASGASEAIRLCEGRKDPIHIILSDVVMPELHGPALVRRLSRSHPQAKPVFMSGYTGESAVHDELLQSGAPFIQKPLVPDVLMRKLREVLDGPRPGGPAEPSS